MPVIDVNSILLRRKARRSKVLLRANLGKVGRSLQMRRLGIAPVHGTPRTSLK